MEAQTGLVSESVVYYSADEVLLDRLDDWKWDSKHIGLETLK